MRYCSTLEHHSPRIRQNYLQRAYPHQYQKIQSYQHWRKNFPDPEILMMSLQHWEMSQYSPEELYWYSGLRSFLPHPVKYFLIADCRLMWLEMIIEDYLKIILLLLLQQIILTLAYSPQREGYQRASCLLYWSPWAYSYRGRDYRKVT